MLRKPHRPGLLCLLSVLLALASLSADLADGGWEPVAKGVDYRAFKLPGPVRAFVARMARSDSTLTPSPVAACWMARKPWPRWPSDTMTA